MRIDLAETGNKDIDIEFNGKVIEAVLWADDETGQCEVIEKHWSTGELVRDPEGKFGYRTLLLNGKVKINDRRPKPTSQGDTVFDFQYPGMCCLRVSPARYSADSASILVQTHPDKQTVHSFYFNDLKTTELVEYVMVLADRVNLQSVEVEVMGIGSAVYGMLAAQLNCPVFPA